MLPKDFDLLTQEQLLKLSNLVEDWAHEVEHNRLTEYFKCRRTKYDRYAKLVYMAWEDTNGQSSALPNVLRVAVLPKYVAVIALGMDVDGSLEGHYTGVDALPDWVQERLAVLMVTDAKSKPTPYIDGVGRRISEFVYWVDIPSA